VTVDLYAVIFLKVLPESALGCANEFFILLRSKSS